MYIELYEKIYTYSHMYSFLALSNKKENKREQVEIYGGKNVQLIKLQLCVFNDITHV